MVTGVAALAIALVSAPVAQARPGDVDPSFGGGILTNQPSSSTIATLLLQADGKPIAVAQSLMVRYLPDGAQDGGFGNDGVVDIEHQGFDQNPAAALDPDGDIVVAGGIANSSNYRYTSVERYRSNGSLDTSFGSNGQVTTPTGGYGANAVAVQADRKIVVGATGDNGIELLRYLPDGALDSTFGSNGIVSTTLGGRVKALVLDGQGRILIAFGDSVMRFDPDGTVDQTFGSGGQATVGEAAAALALQPDGAIVVAGYGPGIGITRLTGGGQPDGSFGSGGTVVVPPYASSNPAGQPTTGALGVTVEPDGRIVAVGYNWDGGYGAPDELALVRVDRSGALDGTFGDNGRALTALTPPLTGQLTAVAAQPDGNLMTAGWATGDGIGHLVVARFLGGGLAAGESFACCTPSGVAGSSAPHHVCGSTHGRAAARTRLAVALRRSKRLLEANLRTVAAGIIRLERTGSTSALEHALARGCANLSRSTVAIHAAGGAGGLAKRRSKALRFLAAVRTTFSRLEVTEATIARLPRRIRKDRLAPVAQTIARYITRASSMLASTR